MHHDKAHLQFQQEIINEEANNKKDNNEEAEGPKKESKAKKIFLLVIGLILIILMLSYVFATFPIADIIVSAFSSSLLDGNKLETDELVLVFENNLEEKVEEFYLKQQALEFSLCLQGYKVQQTKPTYYITSLYQPKMYKQIFNQVTFEACSAESLVILHTHPFKRCAASATDLRMLQATQERNPETIMVVMCERKRFAVYN